MTWDDDRPGMMRVHVAQERARELCERHTMAYLRSMAKQRGISLSGCHCKADVAFELVLAGVKP